VVPMEVTGKRNTIPRPFFPQLVVVLLEDDSRSCSVFVLHFCCFLFFSSIFYDKQNAAI